nr:uncharacterized protein LOC113803897 [Penaeus vannamei]
MRWNAGKILKVALPVALLAVFAFVTQPRNLSLLREDHNVTLVLSARQMKAMMEARQPKQTQHETKVDSKGDTRKEKPLLASEDIVVINNKVYDRNEVNLTALQTQTQTLKKVLVNKRENRTHLWPPTLELSDAAFLEHLDYSKYRPKERSVLRRRVGVFVERARRVGRVCRAAPPPAAPPNAAASCGIASTRRASSSVRITSLRERPEQLGVKPLYSEQEVVETRRKTSIKRPILVLFTTGLHSRQGSTHG